MWNYQRSTVTTRQNQRRGNTQSRCLTHKRYTEHWPPQLEQNDTHSDTGSDRRGGDECAEVVFGTSCPHPELALLITHCI